MQRLRSLFFTVLILSFCHRRGAPCIRHKHPANSGRNVLFVSLFHSGRVRASTSPRDLLADKLAAKWGQPVVVENRPGGDAFLAITGCAQRT